MTDDNAILDRLRDELRTELTDNILPYWMDNMVDPRGGFYGRRDGNNVLHPDAPKGAILNARILWSFAAAYRVLGTPQYLDMATRAKREIIDRFYDPEYGGIYWSLDAEGRPLDTRKQFYAIGFAIYGLSEYARATGDAEAREYAIRLFEDIETHSRDTLHGGYIEALARDWSPLADMRLSDKDANTAKSMNTHLHIIEPYTNLMRIWNDARLREAVTSLLRLFIGTIAQHDNCYHMGLFFDTDWTPRSRGDISYGHDIEASWLLLDTARTLGDPQLIALTLDATRHIADAALEGLCHDGSLIYERHADGRYDNDRHWWVQAEAVIGQTYLALHHHRPGMAAGAYRTWTYIRDNLRTSRGEWLWSLQYSPTPDSHTRYTAPFSLSHSPFAPNHTDDIAGFWKCPYHNTRLCLHLLDPALHPDFNPAD